MRNATLAAVLGLILLAAAAVAAEPFTLEAFLETPVLSDPVVSPDGAHVAWTRRVRDLEEDEYVRTLWLAEARGGASRRVTWDDGFRGGAAWRPDGALSYLAKRGDKTQVWINPLDGTEARPVTDLPDGVHAYWWSPDGTRLAVLAPPAAPEEEKDERADWIVRDRIEDPAEYDQLWVVPVEPDAPSAADPLQITSAPLNIHHAAWSPDGAVLAVTYNERFSGLVDEEQRVGLVPAAGGELRRVSDPQRHASLAGWSHDGRHLAWFADRDADLRAYLNKTALVVADADGANPRRIAPDLGGDLNGYASVPTDPPAWSADDRWILTTVARGRDLDLFRIRVSDGRAEPVAEPGANIGAFSLAGGTLAWLQSNQHRPGSVWAAPAGKPAKARLLATTDDAVAAYDLRPPLRLDLPGADGLTVEGFLFLPPGKTVDDGPFPFIMEMHGGPYSRYGDAWTTRYPWQVLSHRGYAVFIANPRGGTAYSQEFLRGVYRNFGTDDYRDLMAACDALVDMKIADPDRMGFTGYSYGGLSTNNVISRTDRFRAAVSIAGIFNYVSAMGQNNPQLFIDSYDRPWDHDLQRLWEHSPASRIAQAVTPTLIMHGTEDEPVDPRQSIELFTYLQLNGVPSRLVLYPGENHGINRPSHMLDYETRELEWFDHYLLGDEEAEGAAAPVPVEP
ncbi:MAG TPA: S9 family peptidase, partial [Candidatus Krumholzibacteria bacterium]|nr:S9 family peptidase [Candidatus Krumholzibacteria bacterium]HRX52776.1 S9 family peptidase [Candidatus Krumholzibacteria bacterium]